MSNIPNEAIPDATPEDEFGTETTTLARRAADLVREILLRLAIAAGAIAAGVAAAIPLARARSRGNASKANGRSTGKQRRQRDEVLAGEEVVPLGPGAGLRTPRRAPSKAARGLASVLGMIGEAGEIPGVDRAIGEAVADAAVKVELPVDPGLAQPRGESLDLRRRHDRIVGAVAEQQLGPDRPIVLCGPRQDAGVEARHRRAACRPAPARSPPPRRSNSRSPPAARIDSGCSCSTASAAAHRALSIGTSARSSWTIACAPAIASGARHRRRHAEQVHREGDMAESAASRAARSFVSVSPPPSWMNEHARRAARPPEPSARKPVKPCRRLAS